MSHLGHGGDKFNKTDKFGNPIQYTGGNIGGHGHKTRTSGSHTTGGNTGAHGAQAGGEHGIGAVNHVDKGHGKGDNIGDHGHKNQTGGAHATGGVSPDTYGDQTGGEHETDVVNHGNNKHDQGGNIGGHSHKIDTDGAHVTRGITDANGAKSTGREHETGAVNHGNKGHGQGDILHRSNNSSSSSSEDDGLGGRRKKKSIKNKIKEKLPGGNKPTTGGQDAYTHGHGATTTPNVGASTTHGANGGHGTDEQPEKKGFMEKIKNKLTGATTTPQPQEGHGGGGHEDASATTTKEPNGTHGTDEQHEKKGFMEKIKDKLTGHH